MLGLCKNTKLPKLVVKILHIFGNLRLDNTEIVVVQFLSFGRFCSEKRSACKAKIGTLVIHFFCNKEVFLLGTYRCSDAFYIIVSKELEYSQSLYIQSFH